MSSDLTSKILLPFAIILLVVISVSFWIGRATSPSQAKASDSRESLPVENKKQTINKTLSFPIKDAKGNEITKLRYIIESAATQNEIILKGQKASAVKGRTFLIINVKLVNDSDKQIIANSRDYVRLIIGNQKDLLAPDIHNDPVQIQAISSKFTRVGFPINETDKDLKLQLGEINGKKEMIKLNLK
ncbi:MAG: hypothetical protein M1450_04890 [Patescibacteria group bacterium]|nr:hypothetical protein [Patescibacteria group bacterium]